MSVWFRWMKKQDQFVTDFFADSVKHMHILWLCEIKLRKIALRVVSIYMFDVDNERGL